MSAAPCAAALVAGCAQSLSPATVVPSSVKLFSSRSVQVCLNDSVDSVPLRFSCKLLEARSAAGVLQVTKNKCAPPARLGEFDLMFGTGISTEGCTLDTAEDVGVVQRKGSWCHPLAFSGR